MATATDASGLSLSEQLAGATLPRWAPWVAAVAAVGLALLLTTFTGLAGTAGIAVVSVLLFVVLQTWWSFKVEGRRHAKDRLATTLIYSSFLLAATPLVLILGTVVVKGLKVLDIGFLTHSMRNINTSKPGGGIYHAMIGTIQQVGIAAMIGVPIGILVAIYLVEYGARGRLARSISFFIDVMTGVPSIVAGLFVYTAFVLTLGFERSGFAASLALTILMIPIMVRSTEEMLRLVPNELRESAFALGVPKYITILKIVMPTALTGIVTGAMLAIARVTGETAPLLLTTFLSQSINTNPFSDPQAAIPTFIWDQIGTGNDASIDRAWAGALTLILLVVLLNVAARLLARFNRVK